MGTTHHFLSDRPGIGGSQICIFEFIVYSLLGDR